jgi:tetratricopeptide (TPR) repeat protein
VREAVRQARALDHPQPRAFALLFELIALVAQRSPREALTVFDELESLCRAHGIAQELQWAVPIRGRALIELGEVGQGIRELEEGLAAHTITRSALLRPYYFTLFAGALIRLARYEDAQRALDESAASAAATAQPAYEAERTRLQGTLYARQRGADGRADESFRRALAIARAQGAHWFELRSARGYADFLVQRGRGDEARDLLRPVLGWFTEGRSTVDYVYADALLKSLEGG